MVQNMTEKLIKKVGNIFDLCLEHRTCYDRNIPKIKKVMKVVSKHIFKDIENVGWFHKYSFSIDQLLFQRLKDKYCSHKCTKTQGKWK